MDVNKIPKKDGGIYKAAIHPPLEIVKAALQNPRKAGKVCSIPDRSHNQFTKNENSKKWNNHPKFQHTVNSVGYWYVYCVISTVIDPSCRFLIQTFHSSDQVVYTKRLQIWQSSEKAVISPHHFDCPVDSLIYEIPRHKLEVVNCVTEGSISLNAYHESLVIGDHPLKRSKTRCSPCNLMNNNHLLKVKIAPIVVFIDDTSGNRSKRLNPFESWSMRFAALPFEAQSSAMNIHFIFAIQQDKKEGTTGFGVIEPITNFLMQLEHDVIMFSAEEDKNVLVAAPLLWIEADSPLPQRNVQCKASVIKLCMQKMLHPSGTSGWPKKCRLLSHATPKKNKGALCDIVRFSQY